jgi:hypothetical protein
MEIQIVSFFLKKSRLEKKKREKRKRKTKKFIRSFFQTNDTWPIRFKHLMIHPPFLCCAAPVEIKKNVDTQQTRISFKQTKYCCVIVLKIRSWSLLQPRLRMSRANPNDIVSVTNKSTVL